MEKIKYLLKVIKKMNFKQMMKKINSMGMGNLMKSFRNFRF